MPPALETISYIGVMLTIVLLGWTALIELRLRKFFRGKSARSLEDTITELVGASGAISQGIKDVETTLENLHTRLKKALRGSHVVRFNAFPDSGGNQSFAAALLNENGDGVIVSSLYSREHVSIFSKPIKNGNSEYELTEEERKALNEAIKITA